MGEVDTGVGDRDHHPLTCVATLPSVVSTVYLTAADRFRFVAWGALEGNGIVWLGGLLSVEYCNHPWHPGELVEELGPHPECPVVNLTVDGVIGH